MNCRQTKHKRTSNCQYGAQESNLMYIIVHKPNPLLSLICCKSICTLKHVSNLNVFIVTNKRAMEAAKLAHSVHSTPRSIFLINCYLCFCIHVLTVQRLKLNLYRIFMMQ